MTEKDLSPDFLEEMKSILTEEQEYGQFVAGFQRQGAYGLRFNPLLCRREEFIREMPFALSPVPWAKDGYYCDKRLQPGKHALHEAGAYYIQEPSAMAVGDLLAAEPGEIICDLCAAPGGKSTQIAAAMGQQGLIVANEIVPARARILSRNIERMGVRNAVVTNEPPERMAMLFPLFFDKILVDAPCSGEGMFRKNPEAVSEWSRKQVGVCRDRQLFILEQAKEMLKPGGTLVYSTCTFNREENEGVIEAFLAKNPDFTLVPLAAENGISAGETAGTIRLWPHKLEGEGHFAAKLRKREGSGVSSVQCVSGSKRKELTEPFFEFQEQFLNTKFQGVYASFGDELYLVPEGMRELAGIKIIRPGLHLGTNKKKRFEPAHALAASLTKEEVRQYVTVLNAPAFLRGESFREEQIVPGLSTVGNKGWTLCFEASYSIGWSKYVNGTYKNHYPKGLRLLF